MLEEKLPLLLPIVLTESSGNLSLLLLCLFPSIFGLLFYSFLVACMTSINSPKLKEQMQYCVDHPEEVNKLAKVKAQVLEIKCVRRKIYEDLLFCNW
jgi:hypothetical protein